MYESYYGFQRPPFRLVADPGMLFASNSAREALGCLDYSVKTGKGIVVMTGEVGTGKTTLVNRFLDTAGPDLQTAYIFNPTLTGLQLVRTLAEELGIERVPRSKVDVTRRISEKLLQNRAAGRRTVVFVDEAQVLMREPLEELRLVSNLETWHEKLLHIVLVGQPELLDTLSSFELRPLRQRVELFIQIAPMSATETHQYVEHRLRAANPLRDVQFTEGALAAIHEISRGVPREVNKVCDAALLVAYVEESTWVTSEHVTEAIETIDPQRVGLRGRAGNPRRSVTRLSAAAAAWAAIAALAFTSDSARTPRVGAVAADAVVRAATPVAAAQEGASSGAPTALTTLIHLASFRERAHAEAFARRLTPDGEHTIYLQSSEVEGTMWHRVLLGDFETLAEAAAFAEHEQANGTYAYAQAVRLVPRGLEARAGP